MCGMLLLVAAFRGAHWNVIDRFGRPQVVARLLLEGLLQGIKIN